MRESIYYFILYFFVYGFLGWCTEVAFAACKERKFVNRGFLNGPICPIYGIGVGVVVQFLREFRSNFILLYLTSIILVTVLEWITGFILEKVFHNKWWDYSDMPFNINGYVCLLFSLIWGVACVVIVDFIHPLIHKGLTFIPVWIGIVLIVILGIVMFADLYVTASGILKMNKRLAKMDEIAEELHKLSEELGENIFRGVMETLEIQEDGKKKFSVATQELMERTQEVSEGIKERTQEVTEGIKERTQGVTEGIREVSEDVKGNMRELKEKYQVMASSNAKIGKRLLKAFPKMRSGRYKDSLEELRRHLKRRS